MEGSTEITLAGASSATGGTGHAGVQVLNGSSLTISEESVGTLNATSSGSAAGIGGYSVNSGGTGSITINGGTVNATGGHNAAGIGGGVLSESGEIVINGGIVNAVGDEHKCV